MNKYHKTSYYANNKLKNAYSVSSHTKKCSFAECIGICTYIKNYKEMYVNYKHQICGFSYV